MKAHQVVITGMGVLAPNGRTLEEFWEANLSGRSGVDLIRCFDTQDYEVKIGAEIKDFDPGRYVLPAIYRKIDRFAQLGVCAAKLAIEDAALNVADKGGRIGVVIGSGLGGILFHEEQIISVIRDGGPSRIMASSVPRISPNSVSSYIAIAFGLKGPNYVVSTACSSGANAIGLGLMLLRSGVVDVCIAGGVEAPLTPVTVAAYQALRCLSRKNDRPTQASAPFDRTRDGFVLGEGAGVLILESLNHAKKRGARVYAELAGYGTTCGAYNMVAPEPEGQDAAAAMTAALEDAGVDPSDVDYINAHGTGTHLNDLAETKAIKKVFGKKGYKIPISSTKSMIGHTIGAAGAIEAIISVLAICRQRIPPTLNLVDPDPECDLDYVPGVAREAPVSVVVSNSFGFGSNNAALVFRGV